MATTQYVASSLAAPRAIGSTSPGTVNATAYAVNGAPLASSNLSDTTNMARNNAVNTFTSNQNINYSGADGTNPLLINAAASGLSNAYGLNILAPQTGNHRAVGVTNGADTVGWFSLNGNVNSTGYNGFEFGPGGSTARDTFLYRSAAGVFTMPGLVLSGLGTGTSPVCPNGTGGALTTAGCSGGGGSFNPAAPGAIGTATPSTGNFTALTATNSFPRRLR